MFNVSSETNTITAFGKITIEIRIEVTPTKDGRTEGAIVAYRLSKSPNGEVLEPRRIGKPIPFDPMGMLLAGQELNYVYRFAESIMEDLLKETFAF